MRDSSPREHLDAKHERNREAHRGDQAPGRIHPIGPPETGGPQQSAVVDDQLDAVQSVGTSAAHERRVKDVAAELLDVSDEFNDDLE